MQYGQSCPRSKENDFRYLTWRTFDLPYTLKGILKSLPRAGELFFRGQLDLSCVPVNITASLKSITYSDMTLKRHDFVEFLSGCRKLVNLTLSNISYQFGDEPIRHAYLPNLQEYNIPVTSTDDAVASFVLLLHFVVDLLLQCQAKYSW